MKGDVNSKILSPVKSIRKFCLDCCLGGYEEVRNCCCTKCDVWPYRLGKRKVIPRSRFTPIKAIRKCINCYGFEKQAVTACKLSDCWFFVYRMGHRPAPGDIGKSTQ